MKTTTDVIAGLPDEQAAAYVYHYHAMYQGKSSGPVTHQDGIIRRPTPVLCYDDLLALKGKIAGMMGLRRVDPGRVIMTSLVLLSTPRVPWRAEQPPAGAVICAASALNLYTTIVAPDQPAMPASMRWCYQHEARAALGLAPAVADAAIMNQERVG
jgi:hypothetical protein